MTYDELLAEINEQFSNCGDDCESCKSDNAPWKALNTVVELHKIILVKYYDDTDWYSCQACGGTEYPCETIEAIEKELTSADV